jgi:hypothetical protein
MRGFVIVFNGAYEVASLSSRTTRSAPKSALHTRALLNPGIVCLLACLSDLLWVRQWTKASEEGRQPGIEINY